jgi:hypothetical protein
MAGPRPAPAIPRLGDRTREQQRRFSLEEPADEEARDENDREDEAPPEADDGGSPSDREDAVGPPARDESGQNLDLTA